MTLEQQQQYNGWDQKSSEFSREERIANGLGWFSIGLGLAEVVSPGGVARLIGVRDEDRTRSLLRFYGLREIAAGVGILSQPRPAGWLWGRVAGDMLDLASLASALNSDVVDRTRLGIATAAVLGVTALDVHCAQQLSTAESNGRSNERTKRVRKTITVNRSPEEVYQFWRNFENLPEFMRHLESVQVLDDRRSHWKAKGPGGKTVEWEAELVEDQPNARIAWRSLPGSDVENFGEVRFESATGRRGTILSVELEYAPPGGAMSTALAKLFGEEPEQQIDDDLRAFKQIMEIGEVVHSDASIHRGMHPGRPSAQIPEGVTV